MRDEVQRRLGMTFHVDGEEDDRLFPFDLVPRVIAAEDWDPLQAGLTQRVRALEAFLHDAYGERAIVRDGALPAWAIDESPGLRASGRRVPRSAVRCAVAGIDLVRDGAGRWAVLQDNLRVPSGIGYAIANRWLGARILPELVLASPRPGSRAQGGAGAAVCADGSLARTRPGRPPARRTRPSTSTGCWPGSWRFPSSARPSCSWRTTVCGSTARSAPGWRCCIAGSMRTTSSAPTVRTGSRSARGCLRAIGNAHPRHGERTR